MIVGKTMTTPLEAMHDLDALVIGVDVFNISHNKFSPSNHLANMVRNCRDIEIARCNFMQHWCKEDKVVAIDQLEYRLIEREELLELSCYLDSGEPATQNTYLWPP